MSSPSKPCSALPISPFLDREEHLMGQVHTAHHLSIAPVGTNAVEPRTAFQPAHPVRMIRKRLLKPFERLIFVSKTDVNDRHVKWRDVPLLCQLLHRKCSERLALATRCCIGVTERSQDYGIAAGNTDYILQRWQSPRCTWISAHGPSLCTTMPKRSSSPCRVFFADR